MTEEYSNDTTHYLSSVTPKQLINDYILCKGFELCNNVDDLPTNPIYIQIVEDLEKLVKLAEVRPDLD